MPINDREIERLRARRQQIDVEARRRRLLDAVSQALDGELPPLWQAAQATEVVPLRPVEAKPVKPWAAANPRVIKQMPLRMPEALHMKLAWLSERLPKASMHRIALRAIEADADRLIRELGGEP